jgi:hypothetical protein
MTKVQGYVNIKSQASHARTGFNDEKKEKIDGALVNAALFGLVCYKTRLEVHPHLNV